MVNVDFAILAPVPQEHLDSGEAVASAEGFVCFASDNFEFFRDVDERRAGQPVPILFYQSHASDGSPRFETPWFGWYEGRIEDAAEKRQLEARHRPPTTTKYGGDHAGGWGTFYKVRVLRPLAPAERVPLYKFTLYKSGKPKMSHAPQGPLLVHRPAGF
jgi:hypothetical protein